MRFENEHLLLRRLSADSRLLMVFVEQRQTYRNPVLHFSSSTCRGVVASARLNRPLRVPSVGRKPRFYLARPLDRAKIRPVIGVVFHTAPHLFFRSREGRRQEEGRRILFRIIRSEADLNSLSLFLFDAFPVYLMFHRVYSNFLFLARVTFKLRRVRVD